MGKKVFVIDLSICNGCYTCQFVCKDEHAGNDWTPVAKPQPEVGQFWVKLEEKVRGTVPKVKVAYRPHLCMHCDDAPCMAACKVAGAKYKREDGLVIIDPVKCTGCRNCVDACPYKAIYFNEDLNIAQKCTGCAHLLDNGYKLPRCVEACPTDAMTFGEEPDMQDFIIGSTVRMPETGLHPKVFYRNIPGRFIAGTVYDPVSKEVIIGARCRATNGGKTVEVLSDDYGDFWFKDLAKGKYDVVIEARGYEYKTFDGVDATSDVNLGDVPVERLSE